MSLGKHIQGEQNRPQNGVLGDPTLGRSRRGFQHVFAGGVYVSLIPLFVCQAADQDRSARCGAAGSRGQDGVLHLLSESHRG